MRSTDISFLRRQAEQCIALSRATFDLTIASRLRTMAEELRSRAAQLEDDHESMPVHVMGRNRSSNGKGRD
ncbi:MAG: hypothetical protein K2Y71_06445 [Xanthobacteraceae bacterium]|nr:hypothetical protein [Xanthobacteraceae bacterium]